MNNNNSAANNIPANNKKPLWNRIEEQNLARYITNKQDILIEKDQSKNIKKISYDHNNNNNNQVYSMNNTRRNTGTYDSTIASNANNTNIDSINKIFQRSNFHNSPRKSLSNISSISNIPISKNNEFEKNHTMNLIASTKNQQQYHPHELILRNNFFKNLGNDNKENISHWTERTKISSTTKSQKYKGINKAQQVHQVQQQINNINSNGATTSLKDKLPITFATNQNKYHLGIEVNSPLYGSENGNNGGNGESNVKSQGKNEYYPPQQQQQQQLSSEILKRLPNTSKPMLVEDIPGSLKNPKSQKPITMMIAAGGISNAEKLDNHQLSLNENMNQTKQPQVNVGINGVGAGTGTGNGINGKERMEDGSTFINHSFANEKTQQGQPANFSIDISKIDALNEISFILSDEKNREYTTSRFRNDNEQQQHQLQYQSHQQNAIAKRIYEDIQKELSERRLLLGSKNNHEQANEEQIIGKIIPKRGSKSNESTKNCENELRKIGYNTENLAMRMHSSEENFFKQSTKSVAEENDFFTGSRNQEYNISKQESTSRSQNIQEGIFKDRSRRNHQIAYSTGSTSLDKNGRTTSLDNRISAQRINSYSSQRASDPDLATSSKSSYDNYSDNGSVGNFSNPYDLIPPSNNPSQQHHHYHHHTNPNLKLNVKSVNLINELKEENGLLKMELVKEKEKVKKLEEMSMTMTQMYQQIQANQTKYKKQMIEKGHTMIQQMKNLKNEIHALKTENQQNFASINEVWPHIARIFDYQRIRYSELQNKLLATASENKILREHLKKGSNQPQKSI